ncbi:MAG: Uma2 family endonuclease [Anaerolineae bacterium]|nr:Uma2 family endonuclease [Anaerolineae bacterium]MDW8100892.1 Uma2 family endonuclease [Anaerolineae bacterium]
MAAKALTKRRLWTYDELIAEMPETNQPSELWEGELIVAPAPTPLHQRIVFRLARLLEHFVSEHQLGEIMIAPLDVVLSPRRVVQPDIIYISNAKHHIIQDCIRGVPDLIVEVVSPGTWRRDHVDKKTLYEQFGVLEYWIVDPEARMIEVFVLEEKSFRLLDRSGPGEPARSQLLRGLTVAVEEVLG